MAGIRMACPGCQRPIEIVRVKPGEDATVAWRVTWQAMPYGHSAPRADAEKVFINCPKGVVFAVALPKRESDPHDDFGEIELGNGTKLGRTKTSEDQAWEDVRQLFMEGRTPREIADGLNLDLDTVQKWIYTDGAGDYPSRKRRAISTPKAGAESPTDDVRTLTWWESQYRHKLADLAAGPDRERQMPTPEELKYFEDQILELGGNPQYAKDLLWLDLQDQIVKEICPELDRPEPAPRRVRRAKFHPYHGVAAGFAFTAGLNFMIGTTLVGIIWLMAALTMLMATSRR